MRKLIGALTVFVTTSAYAAPPPPQPTDVNVIAMPPVEISGVRADNLVNIERVGGTANGTIFRFQVPSGRLHATSASVAPAVVGEFCAISTYLELTDTSAITLRKSLGSNVLSTGPAVAVTQSYPTPIEVRLTAQTVSAALVFQVSGSDETCLVNLSAAYESMDEG